MNMRNYKLANLQTFEVISFKANNDAHADFRCQIEIELRGWDSSFCVCREVDDEEE